jgi:di/tricarboxylate transporter
MPALTLDMLVVFSIVLGTLVLFFRETLPIDVTAVALMVVLAVLEPWTGISAAESISGFANPATITVMAMLFLSEAVRETGAIQWLASRMFEFAGDSRSRQLLSTMGIGGLPAGIVNNTPVVAVLVPVISELGHRGHQSPSKLLIPLSYTAQLGGMLTLIGSSTSLLASDVSARLLDHRMGMFEFTSLGLIVLVVGGLFLYVFSDLLLPERVKVDETILDRYDAAEHLTEVKIGPDSELVGKSVRELTDVIPGSLFPVVIRNQGTDIVRPEERSHIREGDNLVVRAGGKVVQELISEPGVQLACPSDRASVSEECGQRLMAEIIVTQGASFRGSTLRRTDFLENFDAQVVAIWSRGENVYSDLEDFELNAGDALLIAIQPEDLERLRRQRDVIVSQTGHQPEYQPEKIPLVLGIIAAVVALAALGVLPVVTSALAGMVATVVGGVIQFSEIYERIHWEVIFLLAGVIPLGKALERSGGAELLGNLLAETTTVLPALAVLWVFYISTSLVTEVISNNASVVLMIPIGIQTARQVGAEPFVFVLAVTFAASTAFLTPIGYQTNLFVYGPGGYRFTDFTRVGAPLVGLLSIATVVGLYWIWGI